MLICVCIYMYTLYNLKYYQYIKFRQIIASV